MIMSYDDDLPCFQIYDMFLFWARCEVMKSWWTPVLDAQTYSDQLLRARAKQQQEVFSLHPDVK